MTQETNEFSSAYTEEGLWDKIKNFAKAAGRELIELVLQLYYAMQSPNTPVWAKAIIIGALGYFISPIDAIPDILPAVGFTDDLGVVTAAVAAVATSITDDVKQQASKKANDWFGS